MGKKHAMHTRSLPGETPIFFVKPTKNMFKPSTYSDKCNYTSRKKNGPKPALLICLSVCLFAD